MKNYNSFTILTIIVIFLSSCGTTRQLMSNRNPTEINKILILKPYTKIEVINKGNKAEYSPEVSKQVTAYIVESLEKFIPSRIEKYKFEADSLELFELYKEMYTLAIRVEQNRNITGIKLSNKMLTFLEKYNYDYAIGVLDFGFTRAKGNYENQVAKSIGIGILTLGMYAPIPVKSYSTMICFIVDKENKNIAFYRKDLGQEKEPTNKNVIESQISKMLIQYFSTQVTK